MKKIILTTILLSVFAIASFSQTLNKNTLCKKWYLQKYKVMGIRYAPDDNEKNDYIHLKTNMTYSTIDDGEFSTGKWIYNASEKHFILYNNKKEGLKFIVDELENDEMKVNVEIEEMDGVDIYFVTKK